MDTTLLPSPPVSDPLHHTPRLAGHNNLGLSLQDTHGLPDSDGEEDGLQ